MSFKRENQRMDVNNNDDNKNNVTIPNNVYDKYLEYVYNNLLEQLD